MTVKHPTHPQLFEDRSRPAVKTAAKLLVKGLAHKLGPYVWAERLPYCDTPVRVVNASPRGTGRPIEAAMWAPCRKCPKCLLFRQMRWQQRAINEIVLCDQEGRRSWFITLTFAPEHLAGIIAESVSTTGRKDKAAIERVAYRHVQRYLDRLRKHYRTRFRYLAAYEFGELNGRGHYHVLLHEMGTPVLKAGIDNQWRSFVSAKLVDASNERSAQGTARYISKYATKSAEIRVRASVQYGTDRGPPELRSKRRGT